MVYFDIPWGRCLGRIVIGDEPHRRSDRRLSITSQAVAGPLSQQKGFAVVEALKRVFTIAW